MREEVLKESSLCLRFAVFYAEAKDVVGGAAAHAAREALRIRALEVGQGVSGVLGWTGSLGWLVALHSLLGRG